MGPCYFLQSPCGGYWTLGLLTINQKRLEFKSAAASAIQNGQKTFVVVKYLARAAHSPSKVTLSILSNRREAACH